MDVRKKNTYEVLDMIEKNLISESDIIYYIENDYLDNQLLEDVMDTMFSEYGEYSAVNGNKPNIGFTRWVANMLGGSHDPNNRSNDPMAIALGKDHKITKSVAKSTGISNHVEPNHLPKDIFNKNPLDGIALKVPHNIQVATARGRLKSDLDEVEKAMQLRDHGGKIWDTHLYDKLSKYAKSKKEFDELVAKGGHKSIKDIGVTKSKEQIDDDLKKEIAKLHEKNATQAKSVEKHAEAPKPVKAEPVKAEAPKQTETKVETNNSGHTETPKTNSDDHADGIWEKIKSGYHSIKQSAGEHLETAKKYAMEHPGIAGAAAAGAAVAGLAAYAGYKHLKNKKALASAHEDAHKAAMDSISKTHGHLSGAAAAHIHNDIRNVINSNREMFKKDPRKSKEQLVNHFGSDEYKKHLISKLSK